MCFFEGKLDKTHVFFSGGETVQKPLETTEILKSLELRTGLLVELVTLGENIALIVNWELDK